MKTGALKVALLVGLVVLNGCSSLPLPPRDDPQDGKAFPFGDVSKFDAVKGKFKGYYLTYMEEAKAKRMSAQTASETGFYGAILGVVGGLAREVGVATAGAVVGAGSGLYSDRYRLQVQAQSYEASADAMLCMYLASQDLEDATTVRYTFTDSGQTGDIYARDTAVDGLLRVRDKLYKLQTKFELGQPDVSKLKDAMKAPAPEVDTNAAFAAYKDGAIATFKAHKRVTFAGTDQQKDDQANSKAAAEAARLDAEAETMKARLGAYKGQIDQCVAKTAG